MQPYMATFRNIVMAWQVTKSFYSDISSDNESSNSGRIQFLGMRLESYVESMGFWSSVYKANYKTNL